MPGDRRIATSWRASLSYRVQEENPVSKYKSQIKSLGTDTRTVVLRQEDQKCKSSLVYTMSQSPGSPGRERQNGRLLSPGDPHPRRLEPGMFRRHRVSKEDDLRKSRQNKEHLS